MSLAFPYELIFQCNHKIRSTYTLFHPIKSTLDGMTTMPFGRRVTMMAISCAVGRPNGRLQVAPFGHISSSRHKTGECTTTDNTKVCELSVHCNALYGKVKTLTVD